jgi:hypothetical protein
VRTRVGFVFLPVLALVAALSAPMAALVFILESAGVW